MKRNERSESDRAVGSISGRSYWIPGSYTPSIVREAQLLFKALEKEELQGGKGDNNWVVRHRQIPRPWNPTRAIFVYLTPAYAKRCSSRSRRTARARPNAGSRGRPPWPLA